MYGSSDRAALAQMLSQEIQSAMRLKCACLLLSDAEQNLVLCHPPNRACPGQMPGSIQLDVQSRIRQHFDRHLEPIEATRLHEITGKGHLTGAEAGLLLCPHARLWLPLPGSDHLLGLLILGAKHGGDAFDRTDLDILEVVARHAGITLQNAELIAELRARALEVEQLHQQVVRAREDERKRVARELHDQTIQALIGLNYQLAEARHHSGADGWPIRLQAEVRQIVSDVRQICTDLRPATLDTLGLVAAVRARVREVQGQAPFRIKLTVEGNEDQEVPDEVALCVYRVLHEALLNIQKHAAARQVSVTLSLTPDEVLLTVADDGHGFVLPKRLGQLTDAGHFGLVGVRERLNLVHGRLEIASIPSQGTQLVACVPLNQPVQ
jgi:signal transduction histidine kinase